MCRTSRHKKNVQGEGLLTGRMAFRPPGRVLGTRHLNTRGGAASLPRPTSSPPGGLEFRLYRVGIDMDRRARLKLAIRVLSKVFVPTTSPAHSESHHKPTGFARKQWKLLKIYIFCNSLERVLELRSSLFGIERVYRWWL